MILEDKNEFLVKTVHVDCAAVDSLHKMLRKKFGKMNKAAMKVFETLQVNINEDKIKKIVNNSNGKTFYCSEKQHWVRKESQKYQQFPFKKKNDDAA